MGKSEGQFGTFKIAFIAFETRVYRVNRVSKRDKRAKRAKREFAFWETSIFSSNARLSRFAILGIAFQTCWTR